MNNRYFFLNPFSKLLLFYTDHRSKHSRKRSSTTQHTNSDQHNRQKPINRGKHQAHRSEYVDARGRLPACRTQSCFLGFALRLDGSEGSAGGQARKVNPNYKTLEDNTPFLHIFSLVETVSNYYHTPGNLLKIQYIHLTRKH